MGEKGKCFPGPGSLLAGVVVETTLSLDHRTPTCTDFSPLSGSVLHTCLLTKVSLLFNVCRCPWETAP